MLANLVTRYPKVPCKEESYRASKAQVSMGKGGGVGVRCTRENWPEALSNVVSCIVRVL